MLDRHHPALPGLSFGSWVGGASVGGVGIVLMAIVLDRVTQALGSSENRGASWTFSGVFRLLFASRLDRDEGPTSGGPKTEVVPQRT